MGQTHLFEKDQTYHFEALRALGYAPMGGADVNEVLIAIGNIRAGDKESWFKAWVELAERKEAAADRYMFDTRGKAIGYLAASNYYRTAEFLMQADDERKNPTYLKCLETFYKGMDLLRIDYLHEEVPYEGSSLDSIFVPGSGKNENILICMINGFDSIKEESYLNLGVEAGKRGYSFLTYDGPGQGSSIRLKEIPMTHEWAPVNKAVLDHFLSRSPEIDTVVLVGYSLGSVLATKAAAEDPRIDYLVHYDVFHDFARSAGYDFSPKFYDRVFGSDAVSRSTANMLKMGMSFDSKVDWALRHGAWVMGMGDDYAGAFNRYRLYEISGDAPKVTCPVLLFFGETDHFVPAEMAELSLEAFSSSSDVTLIRYDEESGGSEHCRVGALNLWNADLFEWLAERNEK
jgi:pimeloyl-ACP methyl ester carboxylesterase